jgi:capsular exopolysaccharide synthesis family protein
MSEHLDVRALSPDEADAHLRDYLRILYKRRWLAGTAVVAVLLATTVYTFTAVPVYEARVKLLIEAENPNVVSFKEVVEQDQTRLDYYQTQYNLLQSRSLARRTLDALKLWGQPPFAAAGEPRFSWRVLPATAVAAVSALFRRAQAATPPAPAPGETSAQSRAVDRLLGGLTIAPVRSSRIVDLKFRSTDPDLAMRVANAHAKGFIEQTMEFKFLTSKEAADWLGERLAEQRKQVEAAEAAVQRYREANGAVSFNDGQNIVVQKLGELNAAVTRAKTERIQKEALYRQLQAIQSNRVALDTFPAILTNVFIQQQKGELAQLQSQLAQLSEKLGDRHPDIIRLRSALHTAQSKLQGEIAKVVHAVRNEYLAALAQERSLSTALEQQKTEALAMNRQAIEYGVLTREAESSRQIYESLLQRAKETGVSSELRTSNVRIVDRAERPRVPVSPAKRLNLMLAMLAGGLLAIGLAFFVEYLDSRIRTPDEIKTHLGLTPLGLVPAVRSTSESTNDVPLISNGAPGNFSEAFRTIRTNVLFSSADTGAKCILVTSTGPGEGKSVVSANLALGFAEAGQRVLLIDGDLRRPRLHELFSRSQEPGLSNLMVGTSKASDVVHRAPTPGLWLLAAGKTPPNPAELLGSVRFKEFLATLDEHFDWVIVDSPPVMPVADASVLAHAAGKVVFVVGAEMTDRRSARAACEQLSKTSARVVGAVLNKVDIERNPYYFADYYRREYAKYYQKAGRV